MTSAPVSDVSLYELATNSEKPPQPLQMSPTTFKTLVANVFDLLIDQEIPATIWLKLPKGEVWQGEVERFCQTTSVAYEIYQLHTPQDKPSQRKSTARQRVNQRSRAAIATPTNVITHNLSEADEILAPLSEENFEDIQGYDIHNFLLAADSQLKREYFLFVISAEFQGLILAHRPRSSKAFTEALGKPEEKTPDSVAKSNHLTEDSLEQKHPLLGFCSFESSTLREVLAGINQALYFSQPISLNQTGVEQLQLEHPQLEQPQINQSIAHSLTQQLQPAKDGRANIQIEQVHGMVNGMANNMANGMANGMANEILAEVETELVHRPVNHQAIEPLTSLLASQLTDPLINPSSQNWANHPVNKTDSQPMDNLIDKNNLIDKRINHSRSTSVNEQIAAASLTWDQLAKRYAQLQLNPVLLGRLFAKQVYRQEEIWRGGAVYRRQADIVQEIQQENEDLLKVIQQKNEFVRNLGQELRTPLTNMKTALSLLNSPAVKQQQRQRYMDMISQECDRQSSIITGVLDLIQLESNDEQVPMEALRLMDIVPAVVSTYQPLAQEKGIMLAYIIPEDLPPVACLSHWLKQIVINLLHNSIKFTPSGGQVWVRAKPHKEGIQIEFRDTGIGISQADLLRIFERFYRLRQPGDDSLGVGLGLAIVQQLLLRCGGSIAVKSKLGEGSIFTVTLSLYRS